MIFPIDFYILNMDENVAPSCATILFGRPFMKTIKTEINIDQSILLIEFDGDIVEFNIYHAMKFLKKYLYLCYIDTIESFVSEVFFADKVDECNDLDSYLIGLDNDELFSQV